MARATNANAKAKEKKQRIILAVAGVLLLGLLAIQGPKFLTLMKGNSSSTTATAATTAAPTTSSGTATASTVTATVSVASGSDKLSSLRLFRAKDPFVPLVSDTDAAAPSATSTPQTAPTPAPAPAPAPTPTPAPAPDPAATPSSESTSGPVFGTVAGPAKADSSLPTARIMFNGTRLQVGLGRAFPTKNPVFRLAGVLRDSVRISLVKGALADGSSALKLRNGQSTTLMNTVDRTRYKIKLVSTKVS